MTNKNNDRFDELESLLNEAVHEPNPSAETTARINQLLRDDAACREFAARFFLDEQLLWDELRFDGATQLWDDFLDREIPKSKPRSLERGSRWKTATVGTLAAAILIALLLNLAFLLPHNDRSKIGKGATIAGRDEKSQSFLATNDRNVAILTRVAGVTWEPDSQAYSESSPLEPCRLKITKGLLQVEFLSGAVVVLEGPADFEIEDQWGGHCHFGKLRAEVPPQAEGFAIRTSANEVVDLGTEFALDVQPNGELEVHVLDGEVLVKDSVANRERRIQEGQAWHQSEDGKQSPIKIDRQSFLGGSEVSRIHRQESLSRYRRWKETSRSVSEDEDTVVYFDFEEPDPWARRLRSGLSNQSGKADGGIVGCQWTDGRWPEKSALEFKRTVDRVRLSVPGEFSSLTFFTWVRIEGFDQWLSALMLTDGFDGGETHWQLSDKGEIILGVNGSGNWFSPPVLGPRDLGRWVFIATVYDGESQALSFYIDGELKKRFPIENPCTLRIGDAELGNWNRQSIGDANQIRSLNGLMDEFGIVKRAMDADEIETLFQAGNPYR